jgi:hypothetical protein
MVSIMPSLVALFSGAKTLGWDTHLKNVFAKPWRGLALPKCKFLEREVFSKTNVFMKKKYWEKF